MYSYYSYYSYCNYNYSMHLNISNTPLPEENIFLPYKKGNIASERSFKTVLQLMCLDTLFRKFLIKIKQICVEFAENFNTCIHQLLRLQVILKTLVECSNGIHL